MNNTSLAPNSSRRLGAFEELFWLYDLASPAHFAVTAEIQGRTDPSEWRRALDVLQRRHPMMAVSIDSATRHFQRAPNSPIPLRVISESTATWIDELRREIATPFIADKAPLIRATLLHQRDCAVLILVAHHSIADGLSLIFAVRDLLQLLSRMSLPTFSQLDPQEADFGYPPLAAASAISRDQNRYVLGALPGIECLRLNTAETTTLVKSCRARETSVQAALCAGVAIAGRTLSTGWGGTVTFVSPMSTRAWTSAGEQCSLSIVPATITFKGDESSDFWTLASNAKGSLRQGQSREAAAAVMGAVHQLISTQLDVAAMAGFMEANFLSEGMISNLGVIPFGADFGCLRLIGLWGPATLVVGRSSQTIGALTLNEELHLTHTSRELIPGLLAKVKDTLMHHCAA